MYSENITEGIHCKMVVGILGIVQKICQSPLVSRQNEVKLKNLVDIMVDSASLKYAGSESDCMLILTFYSPISIKSI